MWYFSLLGFEICAGLVEALPFAGEVAGSRKLFFSLTATDGAINYGGRRRNDLFSRLAAISALEIEHWHLVDTSLCCVVAMVEF
jgi:hypothetical protein